MSCNDKIVSVDSLPGAEEANVSDQIIIQHNNTTSILDITDFILDLDNTTFKDQLGELLLDIDGLVNSTIKIIPTYSDLERYTNRDGNITDNQVVYVVKDKKTGGDYDMGGFFVYDTSKTEKNVPGLELKSSSTGHWKRINYEHINVKWFGVNDSMSDNGDMIKAALDYGSRYNKALWFPAFDKDLLCSGA